MRTVDRSCDGPRSRGPRAGRPLQVGVAVVALACAGLSACTATEAQSPVSTAEVATIAPWPESGDLDAGTYLVTNLTVPFEITFPDGWQSGGSGAFKEEAGELGAAVRFASVGHVPDHPVLVPTDACAWMSSMIKVEVSPQALVAAMMAQSATAVTSPIEVTMGGYSGLQFDYFAKGDLDVDDCDEGHVCVLLEYHGPCTYGFWMESEPLTVRVVDLNGELVVLALAALDPVDPLTDEARAIFDSIEFAPRG